MQAGDITVFLDDEYVDIGETSIDSLSSSWSIGNRQAEVWKQNREYPSFVGKVETAPTFEIRTLVEVNNDGLKPFRMLKENQRGYLRWEAMSEQEIDDGEPDTRWRLTLDFPVKVRAISERRDTRGLTTVEYTFAPILDSAMANTIRAQMVSNISAL